MFLELNFDQVFLWLGFGSREQIVRPGHCCGLRRCVSLRGLVKSDPLSYLAKSETNDI